MAFKKGQSGNPNGRPKGAKNKSTETVKEWLTMLIDKNREQIEDDLQTMLPKERVALFERLMQYVIPKQTQADLNAKIDAERIALAEYIDNAPDEAIDIIAERIMNLHGIGVDCNGN